MTFEAKVFVQRADAVVHFTISGEDVGAVTANVSELMGWLDVNEFTAHNGFGSQGAPSVKAAGKAGGPKAQTRTRTPQRAVQRQQTADDVPECDFCGGPCWDNRNDKRSPTGPDFKCKDKSCGAAAWEQEDGELTWKP